MSEGNELKDKFVVSKLLKGFIEAVVITLFTAVIVYFSTRSTDFWYILLFLFTVGNIMFSSEARTFWNYTTVLFTERPDSMIKKFNKLEKKMKIKNNEPNFKINRAAHYLEYNSFLAVITLMHAIVGTKSISIDLLLLITGIILLIFSPLPLIVSYISFKLNKRKFL